MSRINRLNTNHRNILTHMEDQRRLVQSARSVALVGVSGNELKSSHFVLVYLMRTPIRLYPINPNYRHILDIPCYSSLRDLPEAPDIVDIFLKGSALAAVVEDAIVIGAKAIWMQLGITDEEAACRAGDAGLKVVQNRCLKLEHGRWAGKMRWAGLNTGVISNRRRRPL